ncbi:hypothetical protein CWI39_0063p0030, partial [Hamiltosporidium magnivora]
QSIVLKKTVETISFDRRRGLESGLNAEESWERASMGVIMRSEMHEEPIPPLKEAKTEEDGAKNFKPKYKAPFILQGGTTLEEPTNNINEESDLEEETKVVKEVEENINKGNVKKSTKITAFQVERDISNNIYGTRNKYGGSKKIFKNKWYDVSRTRFFYIKCNIGVIMLGY